MLNFFRLPFVLNFEITLAPVCTLVLARYLGIKVSLWASVFISIPLLLVWPFYLVILYIFEACFVAYLVNKRKRNIITIDAVFWLFLGVPLSWACIYYASDIAQEFHFILIAKLVLNAIIYSLITSVIVQLPIIESNLRKSNKPKTFTLRQQTTNHISVIILLFLSTGLLSYFSLQVDKIQKQTTDSMQLVHNNIHNEFNNKLTLFTQIFEEKKHLFSEIWSDPVTVKKQLNALHSRYPEFSSMLIADTSGQIQALASNIPIAGNIDSLNVSDRPYFIQAIQKPGVYISSGFVGRGVGTDHIVAISIAILDGDSQQSLGILEGSLDLSSIQQLSKSWGAERMINTLISDQSKQTIQTDLKNNLTLKANEIKATQQTLFEQRLFKVNHPKDLFLLKHTAFHWGWQLHTLMDQKVVAKSIEGTIVVVTLILLAAAFISQSLAWGLSKLWNNQLILVSEWVSQHKTDLPEQDQLPLLAEELKILYEDIKLSRSKYAELNKELENKVVAQTAQLYEANQELVKQSLTDSLTQLENRRSFDKHLNHIWQQGTACSVTLMLIDIDHFKQINDQYGHPIGDLVIQYLANVFSENNKNQQYKISRIGGEEFAMIGVDLKSTDASATANHLITALDEQNHLFDQHNIKFTVSIGVARVNPKVNSIKSLYHQADVALYQAKTNGRNCFHFAKLT